MADTPKLTLPEIAVDQSNKSTTHNESLWILDALVQASVIDKDLSAPPGSPVSGDCYIVGPTATGDWAGHEDDIAQYKVNAWVFYTPEDGWAVVVADEGVRYIYDTTNGWEIPTTGAGDSIIIGAFYPETMDNSEIVLVYVVPAIPFSIPASCTGSRATGEVAATASTEISLKKNGTEFGTVTFAASGTTGTFAAASSTSFAVGDKLSIVGPATADATLEGVAISLLGTKT